jgi:hypothetical protein
MLQRVQRLINIKIAKAYRTNSFEASCVMAGVPPIGLVIEEKANRYIIKYNPKSDWPLPVTEWPHPTEAEWKSNTVGRPRGGTPELA